MWKREASKRCTTSRAKRCTKNEAQLNNLTAMWICGLIKDGQLYKQKELEILEVRNGFFTYVESCRNDLERMRANTIATATATANFIMLAR